MSAQVSAKDHMQAYEYYETNPAEREQPANASGRADRKNKVDRMKTVVLPVVDYHDDRISSKARQRLNKQLYHQALSSMQMEAQQLARSCRKEHGDAAGCNHECQAPAAQAPAPTLRKSSQRKSTGSRKQAQWNVGARDGPNHYHDLLGNFQGKWASETTSSVSHDLSQSTKLENGFAHFHKARYCIEAGIHTAEDHAQQANGHGAQMAKPVFDKKGCRVANCKCKQAQENLQKRFKELKGEMNAAFSDQAGDVDKAFLFRVLLNKLNEFNALQRQATVHEQSTQKELEQKRQRDRELKRLEEQIALERRGKEWLEQERLRERGELAQMEANLQAARERLDERERNLILRERGLHNKNAQGRDSAKEVCVCLFGWLFFDMRLFV
jgi:hypothetical protein